MYSWRERQQGDTLLEESNDGKIMHSVVDVATPTDTQVGEKEEDYQQ